MKRLFRPGALIAVAVLAVAAGVAFATVPALAQVNQGNAGLHGETTPEGEPDASVGSGRENYYVPDNDALPPGDNPGEQLYVRGCSTCHGVDGLGTDIAPSLQGVGAAAVDFYLTTGRMPAIEDTKQAPRRGVQYSQAQIDAIVRYVHENFGGGPEIPDIDGWERANVVEGNELYANNCAQCHNSAGSGGALGKGFYAPGLGQATPLQTAEAVRVGPNAMPPFGENTFTDDQVKSIVRYVMELKNTDNPGGLPLGATGPVSEGYFAWFVGIGLLLVIARWIGTRV